MNTHIQTAIEIAGSQAELARRLGVSPPLIIQWLKYERPIPVERCVQIELITQGRVTRQMLRPEDWRNIWPELALPGVST